MENSHLRVVPGGWSSVCMVCSKSSKSTCLREGSDYKPSVSPELGRFGEIASRPRSSAFYKLFEVNKMIMPNKSDAARDADPSSDSRRCKLYREKLRFGACETVDRCPCPSYKYRVNYTAQTTNACMGYYWQRGVSELWSIFSIWAPSKETSFHSLAAFLLSWPDAIFNWTASEKPPSASNQQLSKIHRPKLHLSPFDKQQWKLLPAMLSTTK